jgi:phenylacetate-coenzyme A ligase PaaK-like adenylate-forming protein
MTHIWKGVEIGDNELEEHVDRLTEDIIDSMSEVLCTEDVLAACDRMSHILKERRKEMLDALEDDDCIDPDGVLQTLSIALARDSLKAKLIAELGTDKPTDPRRINYREQKYECWAPMGVIVHITAGNSLVVAPMASVEGLLTGNVNIMKVAKGTGSFASWFLKTLSEFSNLSKFIYLLRISSSRKDIMEKVIERADCVSVWGGEDAVRSVKEMTPANIPVVVWGHKISFAYVTPSEFNKDTVEGIAHSVCRNHQQSCSSPQCVLVDTNDKDEVSRFSEMLADALEHVGTGYSVPDPDIAQKAEISSVVHLHKADLFFNDGAVIERKNCRVLVSYSSKFLPSPLFRTVWVSPMPHADMVRGLNGMRAYLQTAGLACNKKEMYDIVSILYRVGVTRITPVNSMSVSYTGEPHDGMFALSRFMKRVSFRTEENMSGIVDLSEMRRPEMKKTSGPIQVKKDYPPVPENGTRTIMKSGGTTGVPLYCSYTDEDYKQYIIKPAAQCFLAAGLDPEKDVVADLLKAGHMYGGMNCFISIFDELGAPHLNIGGLIDSLEQTAEYMIRGKANAVLGAPSFITRVFKANEIKLKEYGKIKKVFCSGEHISEGQIRYLREEFGIEHISSFMYGSNENGTIGFACKCCRPGTFHLCSDIQMMEIVKMDRDEPVGPGEEGRILLTGFMRENGHTERYEIGDIGKWVPDDCECGRGSPRFTLVGRYGDVIRIGGTFFNYHKIASILSDHIGYRGRLQLLLERRGLSEVMVFCMEDTDVTPEMLKRTFLDSGYEPFQRTMPNELFLLDVKIMSPNEFIQNETSIKLRSVVDRR